MIAQGESGIVARTVDDGEHAAHMAGLRELYDKFAQGTRSGKIDKKGLVSVIAEFTGSPNSEIADAAIELFGDNGVLCFEHFVPFLQFMHGYRPVGTKHIDKTQ